MCYLFSQGMAVAARSQGKHKQRIWVNISMSGIKIIDEKSGVSSAVSFSYRPIMHRAVRFVRFGLAC